MVSHWYQGTPLQPPPLTVSVSSGGTISTRVGPKRFWLQYRNRAGYSLVSAPIDVTVAPGQKLDITIPLAARPFPNGCCIWEFLILMAETQNPSDACVVATYAGYGTDQITVSPLPYTVTLVTDDQIALAQMVTTADALPLGVVVGTRRYVDESNSVVAWTGSQWKAVVPGLFNTYIANPRGPNGAAADLATFVDTSLIITVDYDTEGGEVSVPVGYWLVNDSTVPIKRGSRLGLTVEMGDEDVSTIAGIVGGIDLTFGGYVSIQTGDLDTTGADGIGTMPGVGEAVPYQGSRTSLVLAKDLPANTAYLLSVQTSFTTEELNNRAALGARLKFSPFFYTDFAQLTPAGDLLGDFIAAKFGRRRLLPSAGLAARALDGSGLVVLPIGGGFSFDNVGEQMVVGFSPNTANQKVAISINGTCVVLNDIPSTAALRAIGGTVDGVGKPTGWQGPIALTSAKQLVVSLTHPTMIRADYPDVIAGTTTGTFNATWLRVYLRPVGGGSVLQYDRLLTLEGGTDELILGLDDPVVLGDVPLPTPTTADFGLYEPLDGDYTLTTISGPSVFTTESVEVAIAFRFEHTLTSITHDPVFGCIYEASGSISDLFEAARFWAKAVNTVADLEALNPASVADGQIRPVRAEGEPFQYSQPTQTWRPLSGEAWVENEAALRAILFPIRRGKRYFVASLQCYTRFDPSLVGAECGNGIFKPNNLSASEPGRHVLEATA